jgi:tetratricopeptide (TPR) repeat protein
MEINREDLHALAFCVLVAAPLPRRAALAVDVVTSRDAPDLTSVRAKIKAKDFKARSRNCTPMLETHQHADVYNLMGFSLRKSGDRKQAYTFYRKALDFDPEHKGALEYLGELYVETGQLDKARENLALLKKLCPRRMRGACRSRTGRRVGSSKASVVSPPTIEAHMSSMGLEAAAFAGRLLLAAIFLHEAWSKLTAYPAAVAYMQVFGMPGSFCPSPSPSSWAAAF